MIPVTREERSSFHKKIQLKIHVSNRKCKFLHSFPFQIASWKSSRPSTLSLNIYFSFYHPLQHQLLLLLPTFQNLVLLLLLQWICEQKGKRKLQRSNNKLLANFTTIDTMCVEMCKNKKYKWRKHYNTLYIYIYIRKICTKRWSKKNMVFFYIGEDLEGSKPRPISYKL
jgi:hypothetical protein